jgi:hypothetical protein
MGTRSSENRKRVQAFIWKKGIPKVAKATLRLPKNGLAVWSLVEKAKAFTTMWVVKAIQNLTNPILEATSYQALCGSQSHPGPSVGITP